MQSAEQIQSVMNISQLLQTKYSQYKTNVLNNINFIEQQLVKIKEDLRNGKKNEDEIYQQLSNSLLEQKPLTQIETSNRKIYKYISKLGKKIQSLKTFEENFNNLNTTTFDHKSLKEAIAEYLLFYSIIEQNNKEDINQICEELGLINREQIDEKFQNLQRVRFIENELKQQNLSSLLQWVEENLAVLINLNSDLPFLTFKMKILEGRQNNQSLQEQILSAENYFGKLTNISQKQIAIFLTSLFINKENIEQYYQNNFDTQNQESFIANVYHRYENELIMDWDDLYKNFQQAIHLIYDISPKNPLHEVFLAGLQNYNQFCKHKEDMNDFFKQEQLNFALELDEKFNYHNLIICPVNKEICTKDNPPVLLTCGHVISDSSAKKLAKMNSNDNSSSFKCPICPVIQIYSNIRVLKIN